MLQPLQMFFGYPDINMHVALHSGPLPSWFDSTLGHPRPGSFSGPQLPWPSSGSQTHRASLPLRTSDHAGSSVQNSPPFFVFLTLDPPQSLHEYLISVLECPRCPREALLCVFIAPCASLLPTVLSAIGSGWARSLERGPAL